MARLVGIIILASFVGDINEFSLDVGKAWNILKDMKGRCGTFVLLRSLGHGSRPMFSTSLEHLPLTFHVFDSGFDLQLFKIKTIRNWARRGHGGRGGCPRKLNSWVGFVAACWILFLTFVRAPVAKRLQSLSPELVRQFSCKSQLQATCVPHRYRHSSPGVEAHTCPRCRHRPLPVSTSRVPASYSRNRCMMWAGRWALRAMGGWV